MLHSNIEFTTEVELDNAINFLDLIIPETIIDMNFSHFINLIVQTIQSNTRELPIIVGYID